jgi:hypothetical protein
LKEVETPGMKASPAVVLLEVVEGSMIHRIFEGSLKEMAVGPVCHSNCFETFERSS